MLLAFILPLQCYISPLEGTWVLARFCLFHHYWGTLLITIWCTLHISHKEIKIEMYSLIDWQINCWSLQKKLKICTALNTFSCFCCFFFFFWFGFFESSTFWAARVCVKHKYSPQRTNGACLCISHTLVSRYFRVILLYLPAVVR